VELLISIALVGMVCVRWAVMGLNYPPPSVFKTPTGSQGKARIRWALYQKDGLSYIAPHDNRS
jgi:hypothetical protein